MVPLNAGSDWEVLAPAKLNLYLEVLGKRCDGYHDLETLMVPIQVYDQLRWSPRLSSKPQRGEVCSLSVDSCALNEDSAAVESLSSEDNLVLKAARSLAHRAGVTPRGHFHLTKRIPLQAGLGGGSSNAAAALRLANVCWKAGLGEAELADLAATLGSDVPFFLQTGPAVCRGRGEILTSPGGLPKLHFVLVKPESGLATADVYQELTSSGELERKTKDQSKADLRELLIALRRGDLATACRWLANRLESIATRIAPDILRIKADLARAGCWGSLMTGSGSAVFGIARSARHARSIARRHSLRELGTVLVTSTGW